MNVNQVLDNVSRKIEDAEFSRFVEKVLSATDTLTPDNTYEIFNLRFISENPVTNETFIYEHGILEEDYGLSSAFFDSGIDSLHLKSLISRQFTKRIRNSFSLDGSINSPEEIVRKVGKLDEVNRAGLRSSYQKYSIMKPLHKRIEGKELELTLRSELRTNDIDIDFEYAVFDGALSTKVKSENFKVRDNLKLYQSPLFVDDDELSNFRLIVNFPDKKKFLLESILYMAILSIIFTLIIIIAYSSALYQLIKQKQISEIKTDFINNMTHEFKTPIATINLALDAIKNPKTLANQEKVMMYLNMIKEENKRMHAQVENVLRISKLEKNQLDISKDRVSFNDLVQDAIIHVSLIVENRGGYINTHLEATRDDVLASEIHFTNVIINILDNAIKYSPESPKIDVYTENVGNFIIVKIVDQGSGMSKAVLKKIFEKFYREHTGDIHNVKGHGLGLAYVKRIVDDHQGEVYVESEKEKGSTFYIKVPLI
jgi:two-component system phosphate regulon sensor histidine kinase PhoR